MMSDDPSPDMSPGSADPSSKCCEDCRTTTTPLWRAGPSGPKSLCNACGIRYRKNRRTTTPGLKKENREIAASAAAVADGSDGGEKFKLSLKLQISGLWDERSMIQKKRRWRRRRRSMLGEEEQAAVLLMALSSGFLYA